MKNWALIAVKANMENKTTAALEKRGIKFYQPALNNRAGTGLCKTPLQGLLFVNVSNVFPAEVLRIEKHTRCVYWKNEPVMVSADTVEKIRMICEGYNNVVFEKIPVSPHLSTVVREETVFKRNAGTAGYAYKQILVFVPCLGYKLSAVKETPLQTAPPVQPARVTKMMRFLFGLAF